MIEVTPTTALLLYLALFLLLCFGAWIVSHYKGRKKKGIPPHFQLNRCEYCSFTYLIKTGQEISVCPQCHSYNQKL